MRPKKGARIHFQLDSETAEQEGRVTKVGKLTGKDKNQCWIRGKDEEEISFNFSREVKEWRNIQAMQVIRGKGEVRDTYGRGTGCLRDYKGF